VRLDHLVTGANLLVIVRVQLQRLLELEQEYRRNFEKGECCVDRPDMAIFASFEVTRVAFDPTTTKAVVAYVQADSASDNTTFERTGEGEWAEKAIWPRFQNLVAELNAQQGAPADRTSFLLVVNGHSRSDASDRRDRPAVDDVLAPSN
jgi:hypothetical protein